MSVQTNFQNKPTSKTHDFKIVYLGPSFESGIRINQLIENLQSIEELIYNVVDVNYEAKVGINSSKEIQEIKVSLQQGSIIEQIIVHFLHPDFSSIAQDMIIGLFWYLLSRRDAEQTDKKLERIQALIERGQLKNVKRISNPLQTKGDKLQIIENNIVKIEINVEEKETIEKKIEELESIPEEQTIEMVEGYVNAVNIDTTMRQFHLKGANAVKLHTDLSRREITALIDQPVRAKAKVYRKHGVIRRIEILEYTILQRKLDDFKK